MRRLSLLRHAKSSWDEPGLADADRPLAPRGERDAVRLAGWLETSALDPALVLCSTALRVAQTFEAIRPSIAKARVVSESDLYGAGAADLLWRIGEVPADVRSLLVIGHNPGLHDLAVALVGAGDTGLAASLRRKLPTAALVVLDVQAGSWGDLHPGSARLAAFIRPRDLS